MIPKEVSAETTETHHWYLCVCTCMDVCLCTYLILRYQYITDTGG